MKPRDNESRFNIEVKDEDKSLRNLWDKVKSASNGAIEARIKLARTQFPDLHIDATGTTNAAVLRQLCVFYLEHHTTPPQPETPQ